MLLDGEGELMMVMMALSSWFALPVQLLEAHSGAVFVRLIPPKEGNRYN